MYLLFVGRCICCKSDTYLQAAPYYVNPSHFHLASWKIFEHLYLPPSDIKLRARRVLWQKEKIMCCIFQCFRKKCIFCVQTILTISNGWRACSIFGRFVPKIFVRFAPNSVDTPVDFLVTVCLLGNVYPSLVYISSPDTQPAYDGEKPWAEKKEFDDQNAESKFTGSSVIIWSYSS